MWSRFWDSFGAGDNDSQTSSDPATTNGTSRNNAAASALSPEPEIMPHESASMVAHRKHATDTINDTRSSMSSSRNNHSDHGGDHFAFKFTTEAGKTHRFMSPRNSYSKLSETIREKISGETTRKIKPSIYYIDDDGDEVLMSSDGDVEAAVQLAERLGQNRVLLHVYYSTEQAAAAARKQQQQTSLFLRQDIMLPAAITFLGAVIIGVVVFSRNNRI